MHRDTRLSPFPLYQLENVQNAGGFFHSVGANGRSPLHFHDIAGGDSRRYDNKKYWKCPFVLPFNIDYKLIIMVYLFYHDYINTKYNASSYI